jgi:hypothetical protein
MRTILIVIAVSVALNSCGSGAATKAVPGAGGDHLYDLMDEDTTEQKLDSADKRNK